MLRLNDARGWALQATDGDIGRVADFYFDDERWTVRYVVADTGHWLPGRRVLISPRSVEHVDRDGKRVVLDLTREQIHESPPLTNELPVSRAYEAEFTAYYNYPTYWGSGALWGASPFPRGWTHPPARRPPDGSLPDPEASHVRSVREVSGYHLQALDGEIGHVDDFLMDDVTWAIRYLLVDTSNWIGGRSVLISPEWTRRVDWVGSRIHLDVSRDEVRRSPEYHPDRMPGRDDERRLHEHYHRPVYRG